MFKLTTVNHHVQKSIIDLLIHTEVARFRDLRPAGIDTNVFSYHINTLIKLGLVTKREEGYTLTAMGVSYVDRVGTEKSIIRRQPDTISMLLIQNSNGDILLQRHHKQPYINAWTLPYGKILIDDTSLEEAAQREVHKKFGLIDQPLRHIGICYIRVHSGNDIVSTTTTHVFAFNSDAIETSDDVVWARPHKLGDFKLAPAVESIMTRGFFNDQFFFEEFDTDWPA